MKKKIFSLLILTFTLIVFAVPLTALANNEFTYTYDYVTLTYSLKSENAIITKVETNECSITIPQKIDNHTVTELQCYFDNCIYLTNVTLPDSITTIKAAAFGGCKNLQNVNIPKGIKTINSFTFGRCPKLNNVTIPSNVTYIDVYAFINCTSLSNLQFSEGLEYIAFQAFYGCTSLETINIPESVTFLDNTAFSNTGYYNNSENWGIGCLYIGKHLIATKDTVNIDGKYVIKPGTQYISYGAFQQNLKLTGIVIPESMKKIGDCAFHQCYGLINISIPDNLTYIGEHAFVTTAYYNDETKWTDGLLYIKNYVIGVKETKDGIYEIKDGVKFVGTEFRDSTFIKSVNIPNTVKSIEKWAFINCINLTNVTLPENLISIKENAFGHCAELENISIPQSVESIEKGAFSSCYKLNNFVVPTKIEKISQETFRDCYSLSEIYLPENIKSIEEDAFSECKELKTVYYGGTEEQWNKISISSGNEYLKNANIVFSYKTCNVDTSENTFDVTPINIDSGATITMAFYDENNLVSFETQKYENKTLHFKKEKNYKEAKIMVWNNLESLTPICPAKIVQ